MPDLKDFVPELVCLGVDFVICAGIYKAFSNTKRIIQDLKDAPLLTIDESLSSQIQAQGSRLLGEEAGPEGASLAYAVVRGEVTPLGKSVISAYAPETVSGVIQRVVFTEHKRNLSRAGFWFDSERVLHQFTNEAPFCLTKSQTSGWSLTRPHVEVLDWSDATRVDLDTVYDKFEESAGGLSNHLWGWVTGDMHKGTQITETMLTKGSSLTAVGQVVSSPNGVKILPPTDGKPFFLVRNTISSLIKEYESGKTGLKLFLSIFTGVGLGIFCITALKFFKKRKAELEARANQDTLDQIRTDRRREREERGRREEVEERPAATPQNLECVVCLGGEREVILLNCGHVCVCADCGSELIRLGQPCPVCRSSILSVLPAYVP